GMQTQVATLALPGKPQWHGCQPLGADALLHLLEVQRATGRRPDWPGSFPPPALRQILRLLMDIGWQPIKTLAIHAKISAVVAPAQLGVFGHLAELALEFGQARRG